MAVSEKEKKLDLYDDLIFDRLCKFNLTGRGWVGNAGMIKNRLTVNVTWDAVPINFVEHKIIY